MAKALPEEQYALLDDSENLIEGGEGRVWWLYMPNLAGATPHIGPFPLEAAQQRGWWRVPSWCEFEPTMSVEVVGQPGEKIVSYRRTRDIATFPEMLTVEDYVRRTSRCLPAGDDQDDFDERPDNPDYDPLIAPVYEAVREETPPTRTIIDGPWKILSGSPPPDDGHIWLARLPYALRYAPEYTHLFPGHIDGFRDAVAEALAALPGVTAHKSKPGPLSVYIHVEVPRPSPVQWQAPATGLTGRRGAALRHAREQLSSGTQQITRHLHIPVPERIQGDTRAEAVEVWGIHMRDIVESVCSLIANPCPTCGGHGWVEPAALTPPTQEA